MSSPRIFIVSIIVVIFISLPKSTLSSWIKNIIIFLSYMTWFVFFIAKKQPSTCLPNYSNSIMIHHLHLLIVF